MNKLLLLAFLLATPLMAQTPVPVFDGMVTPEEWAQGQKFQIQYEIDPGNNSPSHNLTDVFVSYSETHLYVGFIAYANMSTLRSSIRNRDEAWQDDLVMFGLDTYGDGRYLVNFGSNAEGNQVDMKFSADGRDDESYDINFESKASKHEKAYHVELKIPTTSLVLAHLLAALKQSINCYGNCRPASPRLSSPSISRQCSALLSLTA